MSADTTEQSTPIQRHIYDHVALVVMVAGLSAGLTYIELAGLPRLPQFSQLSRPASPVSSQPVTKTPAVTPKPVTAPAVAAKTPPVAVPAKPSATTVSFVHMRAAKTTASPILFDLDAGTTVELTDDTSPQWQGVIYKGQAGYIFKTYLQYDTAQ